MPLKLVIVTPEKSVLEKSASSVVMPSHGGELGVLPGHAPCVVQLKEGILRYSSHGESGEFAVMGGFAEIYNNEVAVFAEEADLANQLDVERERQAVQNAKETLSSKAEGIDIETAQAALRKALLKLKLAEKYKRSPRRNIGPGPTASGK